MVISPDNCVSWEVLSKVGDIFTEVKDIKYVNNHWIAVGYGPNNNAIATSTDGKNWTAQSYPLTVSAEDAVLNSVVWTGTRYLIAGKYNSGGGIFSSNDYSGNWTALAPNGDISGVTEILSIANKGDRDILISTSSPSGISKLWYSKSFGGLGSWNPVTILENTNYLSDVKHIKYNEGVFYASGSIALILLIKHHLYIQLIW